MSWAVRAQVSEVELKRVKLSWHARANLDIPTKPRMKIDDTSNDFEKERRNVEACQRSENASACKCIATMRQLLPLVKVS